MNMEFVSPCEFPLVNAMTWVLESEPQIYSEISRNHLVENHDFSWFFKTNQVNISRPMIHI